MSRSVIQVKCVNICILGESSLAGWLTFIDASSLKRVFLGLKATGWSDLLISRYMGGRKALTERLKDLRRCCLELRQEQQILKAESLGLTSERILHIKGRIKKPDLMLSSFTRASMLCPLLKLTVSGSRVGQGSTVIHRPVYVMFHKSMGWIPTVHPGNSP